MDDLSPEDRAQQMRFAEKLKALRGKVHLEIDLDESRGRPQVAGSDTEWIEATRQAVYDGDMANRSEAAVEDHQPVSKPANEELTPEERKHRAFQCAMALKGKIQLNIDLDELRGRPRVAASVPEDEGIEANRRAFYDGDIPNRNEAVIEEHEPVGNPVDEELTPEERKHRAFQRAIALKGKIHLDIDIDEIRGRRR